MRSPEDKVLEPIENLLKQRGAWFIKHGAGKNDMGVPDILCCYNQYFIGIEVKRKSGYKVKVQQKLNLKQIADNGGIAVIANDPIIVSNILDMVDHQSEFSKEDIKDSLYINCGFETEPKVYSNKQFVGVWNDILYKFVGD